MQYKTCKADEARTASYVGSTNNPYDADVEAVREDIRRNPRATSWSSSSILTRYID